MPVTTQVAGVDGTEENADMRLGATYGMGDYTLFGEYYSEGNPEGTDAATGITVGAGRSWETSNGATVFYDVQLQTTTNADNNNATDDSSLKVPVTFGVEVKASSWLTPGELLFSKVFMELKAKVMLILQVEQLL